MGGLDAILSMVQMPAGIPVGTLAVLLFTFNLLGDAVNDAFNPRAR